MKSYRTQRVSEQLKRHLAVILNRSKDWHGALLITVTEVRLSKDLKYADAWVSVMGDDSARAEVMATLAENTALIRKELASKVRIRRIPELRFELDTTLDQAERIDMLLKESGMDRND